MRDESLIHFHLGKWISVGVHIRNDGVETTELLRDAAPYLDARHPGRCVAGFCAAHAPFVENIGDAPPVGWQAWRFQEWDDWFGRINGVFLVDLERLRVVQYPMYACGGQVVPCELVAIPGRIAAVEDWLQPA